MEEREGLLDEVQPADGELHLDSPDNGYWAQMRKRWPHWGGDNHKKRTHSNYLALIPLDGASTIRELRRQTENTWERNTDHFW